MFRDNSNKNTAVNKNNITVGILLAFLFELIRILRDKVSLIRFIIFPSVSLNAVINAEKYASVFPRICPGAFISGVYACDSAIAVESLRLCLTALMRASSVILAPRIENRILPSGWKREEMSMKRSIKA